MSVAPSYEQSLTSSDQVAASQTTNTAIFLYDISGANGPASPADVPQWLPSEQNLFRQTDLTNQTTDSGVSSYQPAIISSNYLQGLQSSLYGSTDYSPSTLGTRTLATAGMFKGNMKGDDDSNDEDNSDGGNGGGGGRRVLNFLTRIAFLGGLAGMFGALFGRFRGGFGSGGGCNGGDCSQMMAAQNRMSNQALYSSLSTPFWAFRPGYGSGNNNYA